MGEAMAIVDVDLMFHAQPGQIDGFQRVCPSEQKCISKISPSTGHKSVQSHDLKLDRQVACRQPL